MNISNPARMLTSQCNGEKITSSHQVEFANEQTQANFIVFRAIALVTVLCSAALIIINNWTHLPAIFATSNLGNLYRNYLYIIMIVIQVGFLFLYQLVALRSKDTIPRLLSWLLLINNGFLLLWSASLSSVDQLMHGDLAIYIICCFGTAAGTRFRPHQYLMIYSISLLAFIFGVHLFQLDPQKQTAHYVNGTILVLIAFITTIVLYRFRAREFIHRKTVERQEQERTAYLAKTNEELKAEIAERKIAEERLTYLNQHDSLTGLYNRNYFEDAMQRLEIERKCKVGLIICDVDGLKLINDSMGHEQGDNLLKLAAQTITSQFPAQPAIIARVGGDEFAILLPDTNNEALGDFCNWLQQSANETSITNSIPLSLSIGAAMRNNTSVTLLDIFKEADNNMNREKLYRSKSTRSAIVQTLMKALEARDFITEGHADRLQYMVSDLGMAIGLPASCITDLRLLAQFHDIGKVGIPDRILFKPGPLTDEEMLEMQRHVEIGHRIAQVAPDLVHIADWVLKHHEWWDGTGYPLGLSGNDIPIECRLLAIADAYDAMTTDRPYRKALSSITAIEELKRYAGIQFDPNLVSKFINIVTIQSKKRVVQ